MNNTIERMIIKSAIDYAQAANSYYNACQQRAEIVAKPLDALMNNMINAEYRLIRTAERLLQEQCPPAPTKQPQQSNPEQEKPPGLTPAM